MKSREHVTTNGKAAFYACIWDDLRNAAMDCGWALGLHGSLKSDMDIMAMPWVEDAKPVEVMVQALSDCFTESPFKEDHIVPHFTKPHNRVVYTMSIWGDFHLDISIIDSTQRLSEMLSLLKEYEQWEADLISDNEMWWPSVPKDRISGKTYVKMLELQTKRNKLLNS